MLRRAGVTYAAIAAHLELNANTVKTWCRRARITPDTTIPPVEDPLGHSSAYPSDMGDFGNATFSDKRQHSKNYPEDTAWKPPCNAV